MDHAKIKTLRENQRLTQEEAAIRGGLPGGRSAWNRIESGKQSSVTVTTLEKIAKALGVHARDLLK